MLITLPCTCFSQHQGAKGLSGQVKDWHDMSLIGCFWWCFFLYISPSLSLTAWQEMSAARRCNLFIFMYVRWYNKKNDLFLTGITWSLMLQEVCKLWLCIFYSYSSLKLTLPSPVAWNLSIKHGSQTLDHFVEGLSTHAHSTSEVTRHTLLRFFGGWLTN